jgi:hypothetical protein
MRILIANTPLMYRESLALAVHRHNPHFRVMIAEPASLDGEATRFAPHALVRETTTAPRWERPRGSCAGSASSSTTTSRRASA